MTKIEWASKSWNPVVGCTPVSEGCRNCYAAVHANRMGGNPKTPYYAGLTKKTADGRIVYNGTLRTVMHKLDQPNDWKKPQLVFVNSMSDLFHEAVPDALIREVWDVMTVYDWHTYLILTKRPERMAEVVPRLEPFLPNCWLGTSIENQEAADERIPHLLKTPAAVRWISAEPLLGPVEMMPYLAPPARVSQGVPPEQRQPLTQEDVTALNQIGRAAVKMHGGAFLDWVVVGGESGSRARPMHPDWARSLRDQCVVAGVPSFFKQWGAWAPTQRTGPDEYALASIGSGLPPENPTAHQFEDGTVMLKTGKKAAGRELDGRTWDEYRETP